jgi:hypothetical protein
MGILVDRTRPPERGGPRSAARRRADDVAETLGLTVLLREEGSGRAFDRLARELAEWLAIRPDDAGARLALSSVLMLAGFRKSGLAMQAAALAQTRVYSRVLGSGQGLRVLAFLAPGDLAANAPLETLLEASDVELTMVYCDGTWPAFTDLPDHDVAILAINRSEETAPLLSQLVGAFDGWPRPVVNGRPERIAALTRDGLSAALAGQCRLVFPDIRRMSRRRLLAATRATSPRPWGGPAFPVVVRSVASDPGQRPEKVDEIAGLKAWLPQVPDGDVEVAAFYDYSGRDGLFRRFRVAVIDGKPHLNHVAVSPHWRARDSRRSMEWVPGHRAEEARLRATFNETFAVRHRIAFDVLVEAVQLDCFDVDCAETIEGQLLVLEVGVAMRTHPADPPRPHPHAAPAASKLSAAFVAALTARAARRASLLAAFWPGRRRPLAGAPSDVAPKRAYADPPARRL